MVRIMKNDVFSFNRFSRYLATDIRNAVSNYGITILVMATLGLSIDVFTGLFSMIVSDGWHGMGIVSRSVLFMIAFLVILISAPSKLFGHVTDRKEGSAFLTLPVSTLEKTISMVLVACVLVPAAFVIVYFSIDLIVCCCDPTCGESLISAVATIKVEILDKLGEAMAELSAVMQNPEALVSPLLYVDDFIQISLLFLLGALVFKKSKIAKTIGCLILISMVLSMIATPLMMVGIKDEMEQLVMNNELTPFNFPEHFPFITWICQHLALSDTVSDTVMNLLLMFFIWLRIKKINH